MKPEDKLILMEERLARLKDSPKNAKCPGVTRALEREIKGFKKKHNIG